jgi:hypothetical protein
VTTPLTIKLIGLVLSGVLVENINISYTVIFVSKENTTATQRMQRGFHEGWQLF